MYNQWIYYLIFNYVHFHSFSYQKGAVYGKVDCMGEYNRCNLVTLSLALVQKKLVACCFSCLCHSNLVSLCTWMRMTTFKIQFYTSIFWEKTHLASNLISKSLCSYSRPFIKIPFCFNSFIFSTFWFVSLWFHISINSRGPVARGGHFFCIWTTTEITAQSILIYIKLIRVEYKAKSNPGQWPVVLLGKFHECNSSNKNTTWIILLLLYSPTTLITEKPLYYNYL